MYLCVATHERPGAYCIWFLAFPKDRKHTAFGSLPAFTKDQDDRVVVPMHSQNTGPSCIWFPAFPKDRDHHVFVYSHSRKTGIIMYLVPCIPERPEAYCIWFPAFPKDRKHHIFGSLSALSTKDQDHRVFVSLNSRQTRIIMYWCTSTGTVVFGFLHSRKTRIIIELLLYIHEKPGSSCICVLTLTKDWDHNVFGSWHAQKTEDYVIY